MPMISEIDEISNKEYHGFWVVRTNVIFLVTDTFLSSVKIYVSSF